MGDYEIYKSFGKVIGKKEFDYKLALVFASWYEKPYYKFIILIEQCKRYINADYKLKSENPFIGCLVFFIIFVIIIFMISMIYIIGK